jgi:hypothetical protein
VIDCASHPGTPAVRTCSGCGRPFCDACLVEFLGGQSCGACRDARLAMMQAGSVAAVAAPTGPPAVWPWFVAYCVVMALVYLVCLVGGIALWHFAPSIPDEEVVVLQVQGVVLGVMGLVLMIPYAIAPFLPKKPWVWTYDIVLICLAMTSACCIPAAVPLLIFWVKPETKQFFGRPA